LKKRYSSKIQEDGKVFEECTNTIIRQVVEMKNLVNEFSNFAKMPTASPVPASLNRIVREMLILYREAHRSSLFEFEEDPSLPLAYVDENQIRRVLINLLDNAVAAIGHNGRISIRTRYDRFLRMAVLDIADDGPGIPSEIRGRLFEPYTSTKRGGTGLGLAIVKTIVSDHKGYIRVRDNYPRGTRFILEFPTQA
jgi:two-component system nitrogen regulation sensor histidine kinase NtrY